MATEGDGLGSARKESSSERLGSWKEIAAYLKRDVRTVQRWEKDEHLPVRRHAHKKLGTVYAYKAELDAWWENGHARLGEQPDSPARASESSSSVAAAASAPARQAANVPRRRLPWLRYAGFGGTLALAALALYWTRIERPQAEPSSPKIASIEQVTHDTFWMGSLAANDVRVYYTERAGNRTLLVTAPFDQAVGNLRTIPVAMKHPKILGISPDGSSLLLIDSPFGQAQPVMKLLLSEDLLIGLQGVVASCASWSPDGGAIAFCRGHSVFRTGAASGGPQPEKLATFVGKPESLVWAPDGKSLRAIVSREGPGRSGELLGKSFDQPAIHLFQIAVSTKRVISLPLPAGTSVACWASMAWPVHGKYFILGSRCVDNSSILWLLHNKRDDERPVQSDWVELETGFSRITRLAWAGKKNSLLVLATQAGPLRLMRYNPRTDRWTHLRLGNNAIELNYSRDGRWVTYVEYPERTLWRARANGQDRLQLTFPPLRAQLPHWSPDGKTIAFSGDRPGSPWTIYFVGANGGPVRAAISGTNAQGQGAPSWSPDGNELVFGDTEYAGPNSHFIHRFDLATRKLTNIPGSAGLRTARWSPNGRYIAANRVAKQELALFDTKTGTWADVAQGITGDTLNWSADSRFIYFDSPEDPYLGIFRFDVIRRRLEPVVKFGSYREGPDLNVDIGGFSVAPDGSLVLDAAVQSSQIDSIRLKP